MFHCEAWPLSLGFNLNKAYTLTTTTDGGKMGDETAGRIQGRILLLLAAGTLVLLLLAWFGRDAGDEIKALEAWIAGLGILAPPCFRWHRRGSYLGICAFEPALCGGGRALRAGLGNAGYERRRDRWRSS
jgi:hypothetical protein